MGGRDDSKVIEFMSRRRRSPSRRVSRDGRKVYCRFGCGKKCTRNSIHSHELYHCPRNPERRPREFGREACPVCGKVLDKHYMRQHLFTQHTATAVRIYNDNGSPAPSKSSPQAVHGRQISSRKSSSAASRSNRAYHEEQRRVPSQKVIDLPSSSSRSKAGSPDPGQRAFLAAMKKLGLG